MVFGMLMTLIFKPLAGLPRDSLRSFSVPSR
jgi:hypothetical protein